MAMLKAASHSRGCSVFPSRLRRRWPQIGPLFLLLVGPLPLEAQPETFTVPKHRQFIILHVNVGYNYLYWATAVCGWNPCPAHSVQYQLTASSGSTLWTSDTYTGSLATPPPGTVKPRSHPVD